MSQLDNTVDEIVRDIMKVPYSKHYAKERLSLWRDSEVAKVLLDELKTIFFKHGRTYRQTVTDGDGNVYVEDSHRYISSYEVQERIAAIQAQRDKLISKGEVL